MHWLYLLLAFGALSLGLTTKHNGLMLLSLVAALGLFLAWIRGWYLARTGGETRNEMAMIDPLELRRLRELAEARKREAAASAPQDQAPPPA